MATQRESRVGLIAAFDKTAMCELCGKKPAESFSYFEGEPPGKQWKFCCSCTNEEEDYYVRLDSFFSSAAATVDWVAQLHEKTWMNWSDFMDMMDRFREATGSYGKL